MAHHGRISWRETSSSSLCKLWIYRPVSWFWCNKRLFKFVNLPLSGGIGPTQSQEAKKEKWWTDISPTMHIIGQNSGDLSACYNVILGPANWLIWRFQAELILYKIKTKQQKKGDGELVHHASISRRDTPSRSLGKIVDLSTCQLVFGQRKRLQIRQFDDFGRNWPYTKSRQSSEKGDTVNWFTMVLFDVEIRLQDHWVQLW